MDATRESKPAHIDEQTWRQHLDWLELGSKQVEENMRRRQKQRELAAGLERLRQHVALPL
jgi:hypothetical protein